MSHQADQMNTATGSFNNASSCGPCIGFGSSLGYGGVVLTPEGWPLASHSPYPSFGGSSSSTAPAPTSMLNQAAIVENRVHQVDQTVAAASLPAPAPNPQKDARCLPMPCSVADRAHPVPSPSRVGMTAFADAQPRVLADAQKAFRQHWGHQELRPFQREALLAWAAGRDSLLTLATGAGKSLCFQMPPLCLGEGRWSLVISPLVALMQDQVSALHQRRIPAALLGSGAQGKFSSSLDAVARGMYKVVYVCPEFAVNRVAEFAAMQDNIALLAVDEAHCISSWGQDFRPQYRELGRLRSALGRVPVMCLTATCTKEVRTDIEKSIGLRPGFASVSGPMNRANLKYMVRQRNSVAIDLFPLFGVPPAGSPHSDVEARRDQAVDNTEIGPLSTSIVYTPTKARAEEVAAMLSQHGVTARAYHAGMSVSARADVHTAFGMDTVQVVVATVAFGMGIDKPSIRRVVHYGAVKSLEQYVQQCGRAGRDGDDAECIAFVRPEQDESESRSLILQDFGRGSAGGQQSIYCQRQLTWASELRTFLGDRTQCRRVRMMEHFGEVPAESLVKGQRGHCVRVEGRAVCDWCDVCCSSVPHLPQNLEGRNLTNECQVLLRCVNACGGKSGIALPCQVAAGQATSQVKGKHLERHDTFGSGSHLSLTWWKAFLPLVRHAGFVEESPSKLANGFSYVAIAVSQKGSAYLERPEPPFVLNPVPTEIEKAFAIKVPALATKKSSTSLSCTSTAATPAPRAIRSVAIPTATSEDLYRRLVHVRTQWMRREGVFGESLVSNPVLRQFAELRPATVEEARQRVQGIPTVARDDVLSLISTLLDEVKTFSSQYSLPLGPLAPKRNAEDAGLDPPSAMNVQQPSGMSSVIASASAPAIVTATAPAVGTCQIPAAVLHSYQQEDGNVRAAAFAIRSNAEQPTCTAEDPHDENRHNSRRRLPWQPVDSSKSGPVIGTLRSSGSGFLETGVGELGTSSNRDIIGENTTENDTAQKEGVSLRSSGVAFAGSDSRTNVNCENPTSEMCTAEGKGEQLTETQGPTKDCVDSSRVSAIAAEQNSEDDWLAALMM